MKRRKSAHVNLPNRPYREPRQPDEDVRQVVWNQPHRRGNKDQLCEGAFGPFCLRNKLSREIYDAGEAFATSYAAWQNAASIPISIHDPGSGRGGSDKTQDELDAMLEKIEQCEKVMRAASQLGLTALKTMLLYKLETPLGMDIPAKFAAIALAEHLGFISAKHHPYQTAA